MNKQRRVLITITYNEMGIIIDTKAEEVSKDSPELDNTFGDPISRQAAGDTISRCELFNRLANVQTLADAYAVIQGMPASQQKPEWAQKVEEYRKSAPSFVRNPLVWALYQTWKEYNERLFNCRRAERRTDERSDRAAGGDCRV